jgi:N-acetylneuraminic acid mutarotase
VNNLKVTFTLLAAAVCALFINCDSARAQGTAFTYQGRLNNGASPANGSYDLRFSLFNTNTGGTQAGSTLTVTAVGVSNGLFTATLDFGNQFTGAALWLEISVQTNGGGAFTTLSPRQPLTAAPYAIAAANVTGSLPANQLTGIVPLAQLPSVLVTNGGTVTGTFSGDGAGLTGLGAANLTGTISDSRLSANVARLNVPNTAIQATATPIINSGFITSVTINNGGLGYLTPPVVTVNPVNGSGAVITAQVSNGAVSALNVGNPGGSYSAGTTVTIAPPPSNAYQVFSSLNIFSGINQLTNPANQFAGNGAGLYNLNGANLTAGSVTAASIASNSITSGQLAAGAAASNLTASGFSGVASGGIILSSNLTDANLVSAGYVKLGKVDLGDVWDQRSTNSAPAARYLPSSVWTGTEMIVWGGSPDINSGGRYNLAANTWTALPSSGLAGRSYHTAVWTGSEMIIWGGVALGGSQYFGDGARYSPITNSWTTVTLSGAPALRGYHTAVWSGSEMVIWGGLSSGPVFNVGGRYNPANNTWAAAAITTTGAPALRSLHTAVWSGTEMIVWGGGSYTNDGGRYNPANNTWAAAGVTTSGAPLGRSYHTAVWTGTEMIVWGGNTNNTIYFNDGGRYNPTLNSWTAVTTTAAPSARFHHTAVWTGSDMIIWGGRATVSNIPFNDGGRYNPTVNSWTAVTTYGAALAREYHTAVWTGNEMLVWGGFGGSALNDIFSYKPSVPLYLYQKP